MTEIMEPGYIKLCFNELASNDKYQITLHKQTFIKKCADAKADYFVRMFNGFKEETESKIQIEVPSISAIANIIESICSDKFAHARQLVEKIYCADFIGMDFIEYFDQLMDLELDKDTYKKIHELFDVKGLNNKKFIRFLVSKLPKDYDCRQFSQDLLKRMIEVSNYDLLVLHNSEQIVTFDLKTNKVMTNLLFSKLNLPNITYILVSPVAPFFAGITRDWDILVCDLFTGRLVLKIEGNKNAYSTYKDIYPYCFSSKTNSFFVLRRGLIEVYSLTESKLVKTYRVEAQSGAQLVCSPDEKYLAFVYRWSSKEKRIVVIDLDTTNTWQRQANHVHKLCFVDKSLLAYMDRSVTSTSDLGDIWIYDIESKNPPNRIKTIMTNSEAAFSYLCETDKIPESKSSQYKIYSPEQRIAIPSNSDSLYGMSIKNFFDASFSSDGKHIYAYLFQGDNFFGVVKYLSYAKNETEYSQYKRINLTKQKMIYINEIECPSYTPPVNVSYPNQELLDQVGHLVN